MAKRKLNPQQQRLDWIDQRNEQQVSWAINYLATRVRLPGGDPRTVFLEACKKPLAAPYEESRLLSLMPRMRAAWRAQDRRRLQIKDKKSYSYELSAQVGPALKKLSDAKGCSVQQVIEELVLDADRFRKDLEEEKKAEIAKIRGARMAPHPQKQIDKLKAQKRMTTAWEAHWECLLAGSCRQWVILRDNGLLDEKRKLYLSPDQERKATTLENRWKADLKRKIQQEAKLDLMIAGDSDSHSL